MIVYFRLITLCAFGMASHYLGMHPGDDLGRVLIFTIGVVAGFTMTIEED